MVSPVLPASLMSPERNIPFSFWTRINITAGVGIYNIHKTSVDIRDTYIPAAGQYMTACAVDVKLKLAEAGQRAALAVTKTAQDVKALSPPQLTFRRVATPQSESLSEPHIDDPLMTFTCLVEDMEAPKTGGHLGKASMVDIHLPSTTSSPSRELAPALYTDQPNMQSSEDARPCSYPANAPAQNAVVVFEQQTQGWTGHLVVSQAASGEGTCGPKGVGALAKKTVASVKFQLDAAAGAAQIAVASPCLALFSNLAGRARARGWRYWVNIVARHISSFMQRNGHWIRDARLNKIRLGNALLRTLTRRSLLTSFIGHIGTGLVSRQVWDDKPNKAMDAATVAEIGLEVAVRVLIFLAIAAIVVPLVSPVLASVVAPLGISALVLEDVIQGAVQAGITLAWGPTRRCLQRAWGWIKGIFKA